jgi:hypothetical protein
MKKNLITVALMAFSCSVFAQDGTVFRLGFLPNHNYKTSTVMDMNMTLNMFGTPQEMAKAKAQGFPMTMNMVNNVDCTIATGQKAADESFPTQFKYNNLTTSVTVNGKEVQHVTNPLANQKIYGKYDKAGTLSLDSISGKTLDDQSKAMLMNMLQQLVSKVKFPQKPVKVGETFDQVVPVSLPVNQMQMQINMKMTYKLTKIEGDQAFFDIVEAGLFKANIGKENMDMTGNLSGTGSMIFGINENYPLSYKTGMQMTYNIRRNQKQVVMKALAKINVAQQTQVTTN